MYVMLLPMVALYIVFRYVPMGGLVIAFQNYYGVTPSGIVGPVVWGGITDLYTDLYNGNRLGSGQYPGRPIGG